VGLAFSTSAVALVNFLLLALFMRRRLGRLDGRRLAEAVIKISLAAVPMAAVAWSVNELCTLLPLSDIALQFTRVAASIVSAAVVFYLICRWLQVAELNEAIDAVAGRILRPLRRT
jgi:putative peptidoglycan lipid II flippase